MYTEKTEKGGCMSKKESYKMGKSQLKEQRRTRI